MFESLKERLEGIFKGLRGKGKLTEADVGEALREVRRALLEADVNYKVVRDFVARVQERAVGQDVLGSITPGQQVVAIVFQELVALMGGAPQPPAISPKPPTIYLMAGLQGSGKTTTAAKLAKKLLKNHKPLLVACDLQRPAAVEQLRVLADQAQVGFFGPSGPAGSAGSTEEGAKGAKDPLAVARGALAYAADHLYDVLIFDTAGRLHIDEPLMAELERMKELLNPHEVFLVVDSMAGQEAVTVAESFHKRLAITGLVLSKLDGDSRGGAALGVRAATGIPVRFAGVGERLDDLELFDAQRMSQRILGMGDVAGLVERMQEVTTQEDATRMAESLKKSRLTMDDLLAQLEQMEKMGPLEKVIEMIPGMGKIKDLNSAELDPRHLKRVKAVIQSMTKKERARPEIIKGSRRRRIAEGSGTSVQMVNQVLRQFEQMRELWKRLGSVKSGSHRGGKLRALRNMLPF
ncbi:MAG TPA: signal recognition particle protein [Synergistaceae bacterium]|nr:signal recognition particle protein [Synergistaceae bacterium]HQK25541.1 signal recognition particle protein [Synergistaceae bacterium]